MQTIYERRREKLFIGEMTGVPVQVHVHEQAEIASVLTGGARISINGVSYRMEAGDVAVIFPFTPHSFDIIDEGTRGVAAIFPPEVIQEYAGTFHGLFPEDPILKADQAGPDLRNALLRLGVLRMEDDLPLCVAYLHVVLACILHRLTYHPVYDYSEQKLGDRIMRYISDHSADDLTLESVSRAMGISASHLSHFFAGKMNVPFRSFINANRIAHARLMMRDPNLTLTAICSECGYSSMRTFRRAFQREVGCLPSEYLRMLRRRVTEED